MKIEMIILDGVLVFTTPDGLKAVVDIPGGEVLHMEHEGVEITRFIQFMTKVKAKFKKFVVDQRVSEDLDRL